VQSELLDLKEAADYLRITIRALRDACKSGHVTHARLDRLTWRFKKADLDDFIARRTIRAKTVYGDRAKPAKCKK
jgi:excisionase family DNA binding protein